MTTYLPAIFALLVAAAGWFYMFYSRAAVKLAGIESAQVNSRRQRLRQACGFVMILLAFVFYAGCVALDRERWATAALYMMVVCVCLFVIIVFALVDVRMIRDIRRRQRSETQDPAPPPDPKKDNRS